MSRATLAVVLAAAFAVATFQPSARSAPTTHDCGLPDERPLWIEYGAGSVPPEVRAVFARPGVVVAGSGTALPTEYRSKGAATTFITLSLPRYVGAPNAPADPATVVPEADELYAQAVESTACATPWIALNELAGSNLATPWSATNAQYRANVLTLVQRLAQRGARPALLIPGNPNAAGDAATWWTSVAQSATLVYEAYYNARNISALGPTIGNRRMRLGMRSVFRLFTRAGVPAERVGFMLGFQVAIGAAGREGLQPREEWFRIVKWHALAARQVSRDHGTPTIWSWGWGNFGPQSIDPDKPAAACVYLWTRNPALCDGPAVAGPAFNASITEGQIVLPAGVHCAFAGGVVTNRSVSDLARLTGARHPAVTAAFARSVLRARVPVPQAAILRAERRVIERRFKGSRKAYLRALARRRASISVARAVIGDELRRQRIGAMAPSALAWTADATSAAADTATCLRDDLPGYGDFPRVNSLDIDVVPLPGFLPFLFADRRAPAAPAAPVTAREPTGGTAITLDWADGRQADLAGYHIFRATEAGGPYTRLTNSPIVRSAFRDSSAPAGASLFYVVRAVDTSRNVSVPSREVSAPTA